MKLSVSRIFSLRDKIYDGLTEYVGTSPSGDEYKAFIDDLYTILPKGARYADIFEACSYIQSKELTKLLIFELAWRIAGNWEQFKVNKVVYPWLGQGAKEWVPVQVMKAVKTKLTSGECGWAYKLRILAGSPCPLVIWKSWSYKACNYIASKIGFTPTWDKYPFREGSELTSLRFQVEIDPKYCRNGKPGFNNIQSTPSLEKWNRTVLKARAHIDPPCPYGFTHFCYQCPVGYKDCLAGTHVATYVKQFCQICNAETWHDPEADNVCVSCREAKRS